MTEKELLRRLCNAKDIWVVKANIREYLLSQRNQK